MAVFKNAVFYPETSNFIQNAGIIDETQMKAVGRLVGDLKNYGLWNKMIAVYPLIGTAGVSSSFQYNLKDPRNLNAAYRLSFTNSWSFASTGITPNGTSDYANTYVSSILLPSSSNHLAFYGGTNNTSRVNYSQGSKDVFFLEVGSYIAARNQQTSGQFKSGLSTNNGFLISTRTDTITTKVIQNTTLIVTSSDNTETSRDSLIIFGARNDALSTGISPVNYASGEIRFWSVGTGLTDTDTANLYTAVQRFQTTLGRQV